MINCEKCKNEISKNAKFCPYCGIKNTKNELYETRNDYSKSINNNIKVSDILIMILLLTFGIYILLTFRNDNEGPRKIWRMLHLSFSLLAYFGIIIYSKNKNQFLYIFTGVSIVLSMIFYSIYVDLFTYFEPSKNYLETGFICLQYFIPQYLPTLLLYVFTKSNNSLEY